MSSADNHPRGDDQPPLGRLAYAVADGVIAFAIAWTMFRSVRLPSSADTGIVSSTTRVSFNPLTDSVLYILVLTLMALAVYFSVVLNKSPTRAAVRRRTQREAVKKWVVRAVFAAAVSGFAVVILLNTTGLSTITDPIIDGFHWGELLGYLPTALSGGSIGDSFLIHGYGRNIFPSLVADGLSSSDNRIVLTLFVMWVIHLLSQIGVVALVTVSVAARIRDRWLFLAPVLTLLMIAVMPEVGTWIDGAISPVGSKSAALFWQLTLLIGSTLVLAGRHRKRATGMALLLGISVPLVYLYQYERAVVVTAAAVFATVPIVVGFRRDGISWAAGLFVGVLLGTAALLIAVGSSGASAIVEQVVFWARYGNLIWAAPLSDTVGKLPFASPVSVKLAGALVIQALVPIYMLWQYRRGVGLRDLVANHAVVIILWAVSIVSMNQAVGRSTLNHINGNLVPTGILFASIGFPWAIEQLRAGYQGLLRNRHVHFPSLALCAVLLLAAGLAAPQMSPFSALNSLSRFSALGTTDDAMLDSPYVEVRTAMLGDVQPGCFYTLTSEAIWYYVFDRPSCSRFHQLAYARTGEMQMEVIGDLETEAPPLIMFGKRSFASDTDDPFNTNQPVVSYVTSAYRPYKTAGEYWFWTRSSEPFDYRDTPAGILSSPPSSGTVRVDTLVGGRVDVPLDDPSTAAVMITMGGGDIIAAEQNIFASDQGWAWEMRIPTAGMGVGEYNLRFWLHQGDGNGLLLSPLGQQLAFTIE